MLKTVYKSATMFPSNAIHYRLLKPEPPIVLVRFPCTSRPWGAPSSDWFGWELSRAAFSECRTSRHRRGWSRTNRAKNDKERQSRNFWAKEIRDNSTRSFRTARCPPVGASRRIPCRQQAGKLSEKISPFQLIPLRYFHPRCRSGGTRKI